MFSEERGMHERLAEHGAENKFAEIESLLEVNESDTCDRLLRKF